MTKQEDSLVYVWDAYCGWCYGFAASIHAFHEKHPEVPIKVVSGGLFVGERSLPIKEYPHIPEANKRISQVTGAVFGDDYAKVLAEGTMVLDSIGPAIGLAALRSIDSTKTIEFASAMQKAFYMDGKNLSDELTYRAIATDFALDPDLVSARLQAAETLDNVHHDFMEAQQLKVDGYPTLLLKKGATYHYLGGSTLTVEAIEQKIAATL